MIRVLLLFFLIFQKAIVNGQQVYERQFSSMGSAFTISVVANNPTTAENWIAMGIAEINRIERLISSWDSRSETAIINQKAGIEKVKISKELFDLIQRANTIAKLTDGAFDISYASVDQLWDFNGEEANMPSAAALKASVAKIGHERIEIDPDLMSVFLTQKGMKIGFGAIGKGYAADRVKALLQSAGAPGGIVNASGDMAVWGKDPKGEPWKIGIVNPLNKNKVFARFALENNAVVTSGDYERFLFLDGERYGHIIDPRTGIPVKGVVSCTVFAPKAELADALATALFVMGIETGLAFVDQLPNVSALMIDDQGKIHPSKNIQIDEKI